MTGASEMKTDTAADPVHERWMGHALKLAERAQANGEVPVGAVLVDGEQLLGEGWNQPISAQDPTAHAEIVALRQAALARGNYRLPGTTLYVTIEPCTMCVGALMHARVGTLVFGAREPRAGAVVSQLKLAEATHFNHRVTVLEGVRAAECGQLIQEFFRLRRGADPGS